MKRTLSILLVCVMLFILVGCGGTAVQNNADKSSGIESSGVVFQSNHQFEAAAGVLTAGEWKDIENLDFWKKLLTRNDWYALMQNRNLYTNKVATVYVHDKDGNPCYNMLVQLLTNQEGIYHARTNVNGYAYVCYDPHNVGETAEIAIANDISVPIKDNKADITVDCTSMDVKQLDLMFMIDTTGSMHDELLYLQKEVEDVIKRVADTHKTLSINVSVNFYRDESDEYIIRPFEFTADIEKAIADLEAQEADGGEDYPEAVHTALDNAIKDHQWRDDSIKLMFFVLDAPPHSEDEIKGINSQITETVQLAADKGVRIIPIASSGIHTETEFLLRSWAVMTGGTYLFLTDDSGIGNDHLEPTVGEYNVEKLNECMIRVICEYCGINYTPPSQK